MPDVFTKAKRSEVMSRIRGRGNKETELALMRVLRSVRITGWRRHVEVRLTNVEGRSPKQGGGAEPGAASIRHSTFGIRNFRVRPDFVFPKLKVAVFVDGCFWHGCLLHATKPATNRAFWRRKLAANKIRDRVVNRALRAHGWRVVRIWEHELAKKNRSRLVARLRRFLNPAA
ncbi:MAG: very short patch repair endonuclease [Chloroflexi bacterium]|nr:very short patch repair endonuclease [Chloroflexota bacterium]